MKLKSLLIAFAITLSPVLQAGPIKWIKDNAAPIAIGATIAGIGAAVIYISQSDDDAAEEIPNNSPTSEQKPTVEDRYMLALAKQRTAHGESSPINLEPCTHEIKIKFNADKVPGRSCLKGSRKKELEQKKQDTI
jgi:hypothetical protein